MGSERGVGEIVFLGLGSNIGDRSEYLRRAAALLSETCGTLRRSSGVYETEPWGKKRQGEFLNQVVELTTRYKPRELLDQCRHIEHTLLRRRLIRWGPRTIDIDILLYGEAMIREDGLTIPHAALPFRRFVLVPLAELVPDLIVPGLNRSVHDLLQDCPDTGRVTHFDHWSGRSMS